MSIIPVAGDARSDDYWIADQPRTSTVAHEMPFGVRPPPAVVGIQQNDDPVN